MKNIELLIEAKCQRAVSNSMYALIGGYKSFTEEQKKHIRNIAENAESRAINIEKRALK